MRYALLGLVASFVMFSTDPIMAAGKKAKDSQLTPQQKAQCARWEEAKLRNTRMPGTATGPSFCKKAS